MTRRLYIETVGCQMNVLDTELLVSNLLEHGYTRGRLPTRGGRHSVQHL